MAAPTENDTADVSAACTERAVVFSEIPSSSDVRKLCKMARARSWQAEEGR